MDDASSVSGHKHGGVLVEGGTLTMNDNSSIFGNKASDGGGVDLGGGRLVKNDASSIHDGRANEAGGGVMGGALTMNDASSIRDNRAVAADGTPGHRGGVWYSSGRTLSASSVDPAAPSTATPPPRSRHPFVSPRSSCLTRSTAPLGLLRTLLAGASSGGWAMLLMSTHAGGSGPGTLRYPCATPATGCIPVR